jgi:hypothetical protein
MSCRRALGCGGWSLARPETRGRGTWNARGLGLVSIFHWVVVWKAKSWKPFTPVRHLMDTMKRLSEKNGVEFEESRDLDNGLEGASSEFGLCTKTVARNFGIPRLASERRLSIRIYSSRRFVATARGVPIRIQHPIPNSTSLKAKPRPGFEWGETT